MSALSKALSGYRKILLVVALHGARQLRPLGLILPVALVGLWGTAVLSLFVPGSVPADLGPEIGPADLFIGLLLLALLPMFLALIIGRLARRVLLARAKNGDFDDQPTVRLFIVTEPWLDQIVWVANLVGWIILILFPFWLIGILVA